jgi:hypothetical protein
MWRNSHCTRSKGALSLLDDEVKSALEIGLNRTCHPTYRHAKGGVRTNRDPAARYYGLVILQGMIVKVPSLVSRISGVLTELISMYTP